MTRTNPPVTPTLVDRRDLSLVVLSALEKQMEKRQECGGLEWIEAERQAMADAANLWTERFNRGAKITSGQIAAIEHRAVGFCDYARKISLYVAELALFGAVS